MNIIDNIPIGKKYKISREELMEKCNINDKRIFRKNLSELHEKYVIIYDDGYYLPANVKEYKELIDRLKTKEKEVKDRIKQVEKEMKKE